MGETNNRSTGLAVIGASLFALAAPGVASAHVRIGTLAVDVRVRVLGPQPSTRGALVVSATSGDRALRLTVRPGHRVIVLGLLGERMLRVGVSGVAVNLGSPTAAVAGLVPRANERRGSSGWLLHRGERTAVWRDPRLQQRLPDGVSRAPWAVPILVDGRPMRILGELRRVPAPTLWPWLLVVFGCVSAGGVAGVGSRSRLRMSCFVLGALAALAAIFVATGFAFGGEGSGMRIAAVYEFVLAVGGVAFAVWGPPEVRIVAAAWLGLLGLIGGLACAQVFLHGAVLSALPAAVIRTAAALATGLGAASLLAGLLDISRRPVAAARASPVPGAGRAAVRRGRAQTR